MGTIASQGRISKRLHDASEATRSDFRTSACMRCHAVVNCRAWTLSHSESCGALHHGLARVGTKGQVRESQRWSVASMRCYCTSSAVRVAVRARRRSRTRCMDISRWRGALGASLHMKCWTSRKVTGELSAVVLERACPRDTRHDVRFQ